MDENKDLHQITVSLTAEEYKELEKIAKSLGKSQDELIKEWIQDGLYFGDTLEGDALGLLKGMKGGEGMFEDEDMKELFKSLGL